MGYSYILPEDKKESELYASARSEGVNASYKDLVQVCGCIRGRPVKWALMFLEKASKAEVPVFFRTHNKRLGHRSELGGRKGRYPQKAAGMVLKALKSAKSNGTVKGLSEDMVVVHAAANKKVTYPRMSSKGKRMRADYELARIEIIVKSKEMDVSKKVEVKKPKVTEQQTAVAGAKLVSAEKSEKPAKSMPAAAEAKPVKEVPKAEGKKEAKKGEN